MALSKRTVVPLVTAAVLGGCNRPLPTAAPTPAPQAAAPTPAPPSAATPAVFGCGLPRGAGNGHNCPRQAPTFQREIDAAIDKVIADFPEFFDFSRGHGAGLPAVVNVPQYVDEVVYNLRVMGLCALNDGEEIAVKNSNDFNDQFDIITSDAFVRRSYRTTCYPAWNAIPPAGDDS
jgi:hypothetical protein